MTKSHLMLYKSDMEREPISKKEKARDAILLSLSGGAIGVLGAIAEGRILSSANLDLDDAIRVGVGTFAGISFVAIGAVRFVNTRRDLKKDRE